MPGAIGSTAGLPVQKPTVTLWQCIQTLTIYEGLYRIFLCSIAHTGRPFQTVPVIRPAFRSVGTFFPCLEFVYGQGAAGLLGLALIPVRQDRLHDVQAFPVGYGGLAGLTRDEFRRVYFFVAMDIARTVF